MKVGLFDHVEHGERPLAQLFDERLKFIQAADEAGIYCLHIAEHTRRRSTWCRCRASISARWRARPSACRLGPLVYLLPLYSPLRMIEEICMLDHLSHGRLEIGVGRGVSPFELEVPQGRARQVARHFHRCVRLHRRGPDHRHARPTRARTTTTRTCRSRCGRCSSRIRRSGTARPAPTARPGRASRACISSRSGRNPLRQSQHRRLQGGARQARRQPAQPKPEFPGGAAIGVQRHIFVAETDEEARGLGQAGDGQSCRQHQLAAQQARRDRGAGAHAHRPRGAELRGVASPTAR